MSSRSLLSMATVLVSASTAYAGFSATASNNIAVYWGQNSAGGANTQEGLATYCASELNSRIPRESAVKISDTLH